MLGPGVTPPTSDSSTRRCTLALYPACITTSSPSRRRGDHVGWSREGVSAVTNFG